MNERFIIRLQADGAPLPIDRFSPQEGIAVREADPSPRRLSLEFWPRTAVAKYRLNRVRMLRGWQIGQFELLPALRDGGLVFSGVDATSLPPGDYWLRLRIADLPLVDQDWLPLRVREDEETPVAVVVRQDPRRLQVQAVASFDPEIQRVLEASILDGLNAAAWVESDTFRPTRRACLLNILAKLRAAPNPNQPLIQYVDRVVFADVDRIHTAVQDDLLPRLEALVADERFYAEGEPVAPIHRRLLQQAATPGYGLLSFRQEGKTCLQIVVASPPVGRPGPSYAEFDIDLGNPLQDVEGLLVHAGELASGKTTDHLALRDKLERIADVRPFIYYDVNLA